MQKHELLDGLPGVSTASFSLSVVSLAPCKLQVC
jgi:hypothetical protein